MDVRELFDITITSGGSAGTPYIINSMEFTSFVLVVDPLHSYRGDYHVRDYVSK